VNASKENCKHALDNLLSQEQFMNAYAFKTIREFLEAAGKKLPTEAAFARDKTSGEKRAERSRNWPGKSSKKS
jgi:hypothetical protein